MRTSSRPALVRAALLAASLAVSACAAPSEAGADGEAIAVASSAEPATEAAPEPPELSLSSPDLGPDGRLPEWATASVMSFCAGENRSPRLEWAGVPEGTQSFALTLHDKTEPEYVHLVLTGLDGELRSLEPAEQGLVTEGVLGWNLLAPGSYRGPCVEDHTYTFTLLALDLEYEGSARTTREELLGAVEGHVLAEASLEVQAALS